MLGASIKQDLAKIVILGQYGLASSQGLLAAAAGSTSTKALLSRSEVL